MKVSSIALIVVAAGAFSALGGEKVLWPGCAETEMKAQQDSKLRVCADGTAVVKTGVKAKWPGMRLDFKAGEVDLSAYGRLAIAISNVTDQAETVCLSVKSHALQGQSPGGNVFLQPHAARMIDVNLKAMPWQLDAPLPLVGMNGCPTAGGTSMFDLKRVVSFHIFRGGEAKPAEFAVTSVKLYGSGAPAKTLSAATFLPFVDVYGQFIHDDWPGKIHSPAELAQAKAHEAQWLADNAGGPRDDLDQYGGWLKGPQLAATGFFRTEKVQGKWWFVDPEGRLFFSHGIDCVRFTDDTGIGFRENYFAELPPRDDAQFGKFYGKGWGPAAHGFYAEQGHYPYVKYSFAGANRVRKYGDDWQAYSTELVHRRFKAWGINTIANWSDQNIYLKRRTPYTVTMGTGGTPRLQGSKGWWGALPDPFTPKFAAAVRERARKLAATVKDDPWCIGVFVDNELSWNDDARMREVAAKYFSTISAILKEELPHHLYLGCRIAWGKPVIYEEASKYCDVVSVNVYSRHFDRKYPATAMDKPMLNGEFHFGALDRGMFHTGLVPTNSQADRARAYETYVLSCLDNPRCIGTHWFQYQDQALTGRSDGENYQIGFVTITDTPYPEMVEVARKVAREMYERRLGR